MTVCVLKWKFEKIIPGRYFAWGKTAVFWRSIPELPPRNILKVRSIFTANKRECTQIQAKAISGCCTPTAHNKKICVFLRLFAVKMPLIF